MSTLADRYLRLQPGSEAPNGVARFDASRRDAAELRLALLHDDVHEPGRLISILVDDGLPPNRGVLSLGRVGELAACSAEVIVFAADVHRPSGLAALRALRRHAPDSRTVVIARDGKNRSGRQALNAGADAFVLEQHASDALGPAIRAVIAGFVCVPRVDRRLVAKPAFSHRERQVLELLVAGMTNAQIAERLYLSESTIKSHVASAFAKLGVRSRKDAAAILLDPAEGLSGIALMSTSANLDTEPAALTRVGDYVPLARSATDSRRYRP
jgi:DNA-binding NarL/FixJ family response regulator